MSTRSDEVARILAVYGDDHRAAFELVERQLAVLVLRTQVLLSLSGIVITVTGFSGRAIAESGELARWCIAGGILVVLAAALVAIGGVLRLRWLTQVIGANATETLTRGLELREAKSRSLSVAIFLFGVGFSLYCVAIAQLLIDARPP